MSSQVLSIAENVSHSNKQCKLPTKNIKKRCCWIVPGENLSDRLDKASYWLNACSYRERKEVHVIMQWSLNRMQILIFFKKPLTETVDVFF